METKPYHPGNKEYYGLTASHAEGMPGRTMRDLTSQKTARLGRLAGNQYSSTGAVAGVGV